MTRQPFQNVSNTRSSHNVSKVGPATKPVLRNITNATPHRFASNGSKVGPSTKPVLQNTTIVSKANSTSFKYPKASIKSLQLPPKPSQIWRSRVCDIDSTGSDNPLNVTEYVQDIYKTFREQETTVSPVYMTSQPDINEQMRAILVDWLVLLHHQAGATTATLYLAVNMLDRSLEQMPTTRRDLQRLGAACFFLASKYEDIYVVGVRDLVYFGANSYTSDGIYADEVRILRALDYRISFPTAYSFLLRFLKAAKADKQTTKNANYMLETTLLSYKLLKYQPSQLAAAAVYVACSHRKDKYPTTWTPTLEYYTRYSAAQVVPVARAIQQERTATPENLYQVDRKYSGERYDCVSEYHSKSAIYN